MADGMRWAVGTCAGERDEFLSGCTSLIASRYFLRHWAPFSRSCPPQNITTQNQQHRIEAASQRSAGGQCDHTDGYAGHAGMSAVGREASCYCPARPPRLVTVCVLDLVSVMWLHGIRAPSVVTCTPIGFHFSSLQITWKFASRARMFFGL